MRAEVPAQDRTGGYVWIAVHHCADVCVVGRSHYFRSRQGDPLRHPPAALHRLDVEHYLLCFPAQWPRL